MNHYKSDSLKFSKNIFVKGIHDGIPIGLGYLAVSFSLGVAAKNIGLTPFQGFLVSLLCNASAGEYAGFTSIAAQASYIEIALITVIANARYLLMSFAMSQHLDPETPIRHRLLLSFDLTDELFGISMAPREGYLNPFYTYGAILVALPCWSIGTAIGTVAGSILPAQIVSALSVALFGMFLAVIIPPAVKDRVIAAVIGVCFVLSFAAAKLPVISNLSDGTRIIILTIFISAAAAVLFPHADTKEEEA